MTKENLTDKLCRNVKITAGKETFIGFASGVDENDNLELIKVESGIGGSTKSDMLRLPIEDIDSCEVMD